MWLPPPGTLTVVMAVFFGLYTLFEQPNRWVKFIFVAVLLLLAAGEIFVLAKGQEISEQNFAYIVKRFDGVQSLILDVQRAQTRIATLSLTPYPKSSPLNLKSEALTLSYDILIFLTQRETGASLSFFKVRYWLAAPDIKYQMQYEEQTMAMFSERFGARVVQIHDAFANLGFRDDGLDRVYNHPTNLYEVRVIAQRIGGLAEQIKI